MVTVGAFTPGDIFVVRSPGFIPKVICLVARGTRRPPRPFRERVSHAGIIAGDDGSVIEMRVKGWRFWRGACQASHIPAGAVVLSPPYRGVGQRRVAVMIAQRYREIGARYNWSGILAIALAQNGLGRLPGVRAKLKDSHDLFCSQLDDNCLTLAGVEMFDDGRPSGDVSPEDLYDLAESRGWGIRKLGKAVT